MKQYKIQNRSQKNSRSCVPLRAEFCWSKAASYGDKILKLLIYCRSSSSFFNDLCVGEIIFRKKIDDFIHLRQFFTVIYWVRQCPIHFYYWYKFIATLWRSQQSTDIDNFLVPKLYIYEYRIDLGTGVKLWGTIFTEPIINWQKTAISSCLSL
jgi:hypothetical protein